MGKLYTTIIICFMFLLLAGCGEESNGNLDNTRTSEDSKQVSPEEDSQTETGIEDHKELSWEGEWIFLSDDNLGQLTIVQKDESTIQYRLSGSRINPVNGGSYGNAFEGMGYIDGNQLEFTNDLNDDCGGVMVKNQETITLTLADEACHTPQVYLNGDYKKTDTLQNEPLFVVDEGIFKLHGISLGANPSQVKALIGNPDYEGPDEEGFDDWIQRYSQSNGYISYFENAVTSIHLDASLTELEEGISQYFEGEYYSTDEGTEYLYLPESGQLLVYNVNPDNRTEVSLFVTYADGNFQMGVENGWIIKQGE